MDKIASTPSAVLSDVTDRLRTRARETIAAIASGQVASINAAVVPCRRMKRRQDERQLLAISLSNVPIGYPA